MILPQLSSPNIDQKIEYFIQCCEYISSEFGLNQKIESKEVEMFFRKLSRKTKINSVGKNFIWNYITYIFYKKLQIRRFNAFKMSWLISTESLNDWVDKPDDWYVYYGQWLQESKLVKPANDNNINPRSTEEVFRRKYLNSVKGFATCLENTSLYDPESRFCRMCFKKLDCREILKLNNIELFNARTK